MTSPRSIDSVASFADAQIGAQRLAQHLGVPAHTIDRHTFPDGESRIRADHESIHPLLYCPLDRPNGKVMDLLLASAALRDRGATTISLVVPYLPYMRQDRAFAPGEAVSQRVFGGLLASHFDRLVTVDPHLHRTPRLDMVFGGKPAIAVPAAEAVAAFLRDRGYPPDTLVLGPDEESGPLVARVATALELTGAVARKLRRGDRSVAITLPPGIAVEGRMVVIVDDVISSGQTIAVVAGLLRRAGAGAIDVIVTHALCDEAASDQLRAAGVRALVSSDTVTHPSNGFSVMGLVAEALKRDVTS
jgi:ribose-phosphate pyrophosphokinase